jgi:hypothetical protein
MQLLWPEGEGVLCEWHVCCVQSIVNLGCVQSTSWTLDFSLQLLLPFLYTVCYGAWVGVRLCLAAARQSTTGRDHYEDVRRSLKRAMIAEPLKFLNVVRRTMGWAHTGRGTRSREMQAVLHLLNHCCRSARELLWRRSI